MKIKCLALLISFHYFQLSSTFDPSEKFDRDTFLDTKSSTSGNYNLFWKVVGDEIIFEAHVATLGWLGLGFSPSGGMTGADIVVGGVKNGRPYIYDRHATGTMLPIYDQTQNYEALYGAENATHTVLKFKRKLTTCDQDDWPITNDTIKLIWSFNPTDAENENTFQMHTQRGTRSILLLEQSKSSRGNLPSDVFTFDMNVTNVKIPGDYHTMYLCKIVKLPSRSKAHFVKYEPVIQAGNERFVHHILIYHCLYNMSHLVDKQEECFNRDHTITSEMYKCTSRYLAGWAVGGEAVVYPDNLGYPFFESDKSPYMMLEIHYDNSQLVQGATDSSGLRLYLTSQLKPVEIGSIILGMMVSADAMIIPPGQNTITLRSFCDASCTKAYPTQGLNFMGAFLHEHTHGKAVRLRHVRNGIEQPPISQDNFYDFNYQEQRFLNPARLVLANDTLIVECDYTSTNDVNATFGGFTTKDEMCLVFINYYPRTERMIGCFAGPTIPSYAAAMGATYNAYNATTSNIAGSFGQYDSLKSYALAVNWKEDKTISDDKLPRTPKGQIFQDKINTGSYNQVCMQNDPYASNSSINGMLENVKVDYFSSLPFPRISVTYVKPTVCENKTVVTQIPLVNNGSTTVSNQLNSTVDGTYTNHVVMDSDGKYHLFWRYDDTNVTFEIQVEARGWVGLGFSPNGGMAGSDIVHFYIDNNGSPQLSDRYAAYADIPIEDTHPDYTLLRGSKNNTHMTVTLTRKRFTCDVQDMLLTNDTIRGIYAFSDVVPKSRTDFQKHEPNSRGSKSLRLFEKPMVEKPLPPGTTTLDFNVTNVKVPDDYHTLYWCQIYDISNIYPNMQKRHIIKIDPMIQKDNKVVVHHMLLYGCKEDMSKYIGKGEPCFDRDGNNFSSMMQCSRYLAGWAVGGESIIYPDELGLPIFEDNGVKQVMLEMHYDNSNMLKNKVDSSGFRLYLTQNLRPIEVGSIALGVPVGSEFMILPAGQQEFTQYTYCYSDCTSWIPKEGFMAFSGLLHTHTMGRKIRIHHIRNGTQLEDLFIDDHFDFNYQAPSVKKIPVKILPNDEFIVECVYDTTSRTETTYGGFPSRQEMCLMFIEIYPRPETGEFVCINHPSYTGPEWKDMFHANYSDDYKVFIMPNGSNMTAKQFAETQVKFPNQTFIQKYQNNIRNGGQFVLCNTGFNKTSSSEIWDYNNHTGPPKINVPFKSETVCLKDGGQAVSTVVPTNATVATTTKLTTTTIATATKKASNSSSSVMLIFILFILKLFKQL